MATLQQQARALGDPTRHEIFAFLTASGDPVDIAALTDHLGLNHNAIRQHLAKLTEAELVSATTSSSSGPGRPKLVYSVNPSADSRWGVVGPYERLSKLLAEIIRTGDTPVEVGRRDGRRLREEAGHGASSIAELTETMAREGFEPEVRRRGGRVDIVLRNCPFESTALDDPATVCNLHLGIAQGLAEGAAGVEVDDLIAKDPRRAGCRLVVQTQPDTT